MLTSSTSFTVPTTVSSLYLDVESGETVTAGGLTVASGGAVIVSGGLSVAASIGTVLNVFAPTTSFANSVVVLNSGTAPGTGFTVLDVKTDGTSMASVRGDGRLFVQEGGVDVQGGGVLVKSGGVVIAEGGGVVKSSFPADTLAVKATSKSFTNTLLNVGTGSSSASNFELASMSSAGTPVVTVRGDGYTTIAQGGLQVTAGGATVQAGQLVVDSGIAITSGGLRVSNGGATISVKGLFIDDDGAQVRL